MWAVANMLHIFFGHERRISTNMKFLVAASTALDMMSTARAVPHMILNSDSSHERSGTPKTGVVFRWHWSASVTHRTFAKMTWSHSTTSRSSAMRFL